MENQVPTQPTKSYTGAIIAGVVIIALIIVGVILSKKQPAPTPTDENALPAVSDDTSTSAIQAELDATDVSSLDAEFEMLK